MDTLSQILGGLGFLGIFAAIVLGFLMLLVLPWLALIECAGSRRSPAVRTVMILGLVLTWGIGSLFYGLFFTRSSFLRAITLCSVILFLVLAVPSAVSLGTGLGVAARLNEGREEARIRQLTDEFQPSALASGALEPFTAIDFQHGAHHPRAATLAMFTEEGPLADGARDVDLEVRHVTRDATNERFFAVTRHDFGTITPSSGRFTKIEVDPSLGDFNYTAGVTFDTRREKVIVATSHVYLRFFEYDPRTSDWKRLPAELRDVSISGLTYDPVSDSLYAFEKAAPEELALYRLHRFNGSGASLGSISLKPPIPLSREPRELLQLQYSNGKLVLILPPIEAGESNRIFAIDPAEGLVQTTGALVVEGSSPESTQCVPAVDECVAM